VSDAPPPDPLAPAAAAALVCLASGAVLVLEILGVRLLAPYVGLTLETTTSIIGAVLAGIAAGAAIGGYAADRTAPRRLLAGLFVGGGLLALATVPIVRAVGPGARGGGDGAAFAITLMTLLPAATVLSAVTPVVVRLQLRDLAVSGTVVGRLSAWATGGALAGVFGTGFVLVPLLPVSGAVLLTGAALVLTGLALGLRAETTTRRTALLVAVGTVGLGLVPFAAGSPCETETIYHCARVIEDPARPQGRTLLLDDLRHSYVDLGDPRRLELDYARWIGDAVGAIAPTGGPLDAVWIGGGGFTLPRWLAATRPGSRSRVLEVDPELVALVRERLELRTGPALRVALGDARMTLAREPPDSADLVVGDAFGGRAVPWHLATTEWLAEVRRVLRPGGLYALNVIDRPPLGLLRAEAATLLAAFADVRLVRGPDGGPGSNYVLLASERPLPAGVASRARGARTLGRTEVAAFARGAPVLTDDDAPADQLLTTP
jgi:SAM-dependent methyltransferase